MGDLQMRLSFGSLEKATLRERTPNQRAETVNQILPRLFSCCELPHLLQRPEQDTEKHLCELVQGLGTAGYWRHFSLGAFPSQIWDWETLLISNRSQGAHHSQFQMISTRHIMINTLENQFYECYHCNQPMDKGCSHG